MGIEIGVEIAGVIIVTQRAYRGGNRFDRKIIYGTITCIIFDSNVERSRCQVGCEPNKSLSHSL